VCVRVYMCMQRGVTVNLWATIYLSAERALTSLRSRTNIERASAAPD